MGYKEHLIFIWLIFIREITGQTYPTTPNQNEDYIHIGFTGKSSAFASSMRTSNRTQCNGATMATWERISMASSTSLFQLIKSGQSLLQQDPMQIWLSGHCNLVLLSRDVVRSQQLLRQNYSEEIVSENRNTCCARYTLQPTAFTVEGDSERSVEEDIGKVLTYTLTLLSWQSTCVLYDDSQKVRMHYILYSLHVVGVKYILRRLSEDGLSNSTMLDCMSFQTKHSPTVMGVFSESVLRNVIRQLPSISREFQGLSLISQWLIWAGDLSNISLESVPLLNIAFLQNSRPYTEIGSQYRVLSNIGNASVSNFVTTVQWNNTFVAQAYDNILPNRDNMLHGKTLTITTKVWPPFTNKIIGPDGEVTYTGFCIDLIDELSWRLNFSYRIVEPGDNEWGRLNKGEWTGMMHQLVTKEVDMVVAAISIQHEREEVVDFTYPFFYDSKGIIMKHDSQHKDSHWAHLIDPFESYSLLALVLSVPVMAGILCACEQATPVNTRDRVWTTTTTHSPFQKFSHSLLYLYGALLSEGLEDNCRSLSGRTILAFWWLFSIIVGGIYTGNLVASRTIPATAPGINSLSELLKQPHYRWGIEQGDYLSMMFPTSSIANYRDIWKGVQKFRETDPTVLSSNYSVHMAYVRGGNYAFFNDKSVLALEVSRDCGQLVLAAEEFLPMQFAIGLHQNSVLRRLLSKEIMAFHEAGMIAAWKRRWWLETDCRVGKRTEAQSILLYEVRGAYYILIGSLAIAALVLLAEIFFQRIILPHRKKIKTKTDCGTCTGEQTNNTSEAKETSFISLWKYYINRLICCIKDH